MRARSGPRKSARPTVARGRGIKKNSAPRPRVVRMSQLVPAKAEAQIQTPTQAEEPPATPVLPPAPPEVQGSARNKSPVFEAAFSSEEALTHHLAHAFKDAADAAATSHGASLSVEDEKLFRAFQNNLLSLISHELRTPLMGVQNAIQGIEETAGKDAQEWVQMAKRNSLRLSRTLQALIDLASIESGTFHVRLREMDLYRFVAALLEGETRSRPIGGMLKERDLKLSLGARVGNALKTSTAEVDLAPLLADPVKLGRALELLVYSVAGRAQLGSTLQFVVSSARVQLEFELDSKFRQAWETAWTQAMAAHHSGIVSSASAFGGAVQTEEAFLTRNEEGLGNEFILLHQIMKLHNGRFEAEKLGPARIRMSLILPELSSEEGLLSVLVSRLHEHAPESGALGSVALALVSVPEKQSVEEFRTRVKQALFRASDAVYPLHSRRQVALVMNDIRAVDGPPLLKRIAQALGTLELRCGFVAAPEDGIDPYALLELALKRMRGLENP